MRTARLSLIATCLATLALTADAAAETASPSQFVVGEVTASSARWTASGRHIVTESVIRTDGGDEVTVRQLGGSVDGIRMIQIPGQVALQPGDRVSARVTPRADGGPLAVSELVQLARKPGGDAPPIRDFVRTTNNLGTALSWSSACVFITYDAAGTSHLPGDEEFAIMDAVFGMWESATEACTYMDFQFDEPAELEVGFDGVNVIKFRDDRWCAPATDEDPEQCHNPQAAGLTTLFFVEDAESSRDGEILDADIELNGVNFSISSGGQTQDPDPQCLSDLANTLTHEVGHLLGLDHTCYNGIGERPVDQNGDPIPSCGTGAGLPTEVIEATMFAFQDCGETKKATLEADDIGALCAIYPSDQDPGSCARANLSGDGGGCCSTTRTGPDPGALALLALVAALLLVRRRRVA